MKKATLPVLVGLILLISLACGLPSQFHVSTTRAVATQHSGGQIVFDSLEGGAHNGIYIMNADGSNMRQLTDNDTDRHVSLSPDGTRVAFVSTSRDGMYEIYVIHTDGSGLRRLTNNPGGSSDPSWSPDGSQIIYTISYVRGSEPSSSETSACAIFVMNADGSNPHPLTNSCDLSAYYPRWSPDGSQILFVTSITNVSAALNIMNADGSNPQVVIQTSPADGIYSPRWSPDGTKIAFLDQKPADVPQEVDVINKDGTNQRSLTAGFYVASDRLSWSPDGQQLIFTMNGDGKSYKGYGQLFVVNADGSNLHKLDVPCGWCFDADWGH